MRPWAEEITRIIAKKESREMDLNLISDDCHKGHAVGGEAMCAPQRCSVTLRKSMSCVQEHLALPSSTRPLNVRLILLVPPGTASLAMPGIPSVFWKLLPINQGQQSGRFVPLGRSCVYIASGRLREGGVMQPVMEAASGVKANLSARKESRRVRSVEGTAGMYTKEKAGGVVGPSGSGRLIRGRPAEADKHRRTDTREGRHSRSKTHAEHGESVIPDSLKLNPECSQN
ncbi:hypothetical protein E2C01_054709 [Portunus trituberculatus]|uniref:Uncharacterized protein n=1 Tax=Portunus trituberculatus TaxID=210409 RepID=A0A5B7GSS8_PORTR|nr:hypothetical protein [Portunus trituberculatus]